MHDLFFLFNGKMLASGEYGKPGSERVFTISTPFPLSGKDMPYLPAQIRTGLVSILTIACSRCSGATGGAHTAATFERTFSTV